MTSWSRAATRRHVLHVGAAAGTVALAGCSLIETRSSGDADVQTAGPSATDSDSTGGETTDARVYIPPHFHQTNVADEATSNGYRVGLLYSLPDFYWRVRPDGTTKQVEPPSDASMQLLAWVWDDESRSVLADATVTAELMRDNSTVTETELVPLLDQRKGLHWARNVSLPTYGEYGVRLRVQPGQARYTGTLSGQFEDAASVSSQVSFDRGKMDNIGTVYLDKGGERGAVVPMETDTVPLNIQPAPSEFPGRLVGKATTGAARAQISEIPADSSPIGDGRPYLAVTLTTPFNGYSLPRAKVSATLERGGQTVFDGRLRQTLDSQRGYHYGTAVESIETGDTLTLSISRPPQIARFAGYEQAFLQMPDRTLTLE